MTDIKDIPLKKLVEDWVDSLIDLYYSNMALKTGEMTYKQDSQYKSILERRDNNQRIADDIIVELLCRGKTISDLAKVMEVVTKEDNT